MGFSILETTMVVTLISIFLLFTLPEISKLQRHIRLQQAVSEWAQHLSQARELAIKTQNKIIFCPTQDGISCSDSWQGKLILIGQNQVIRNYSALSSAITIEWHGFPSWLPYPVFQANGLLENENGHFIVCLEGQCKKIIVAKLGRVRFEDLCLYK